MNEAKEIFDMFTKEIEPDRDSLNEQLQLQRRSARSRKTRAMAVAAAVAIGAALFAARVLDHGSDGSAPASVEPSASGLKLTVVALDGSIRSSIGGLPEGVAMLDISPDGSRVAFAVTVRQGENDDDGLGSQIAVMTLDGTEMHTLTKGGRQSAGWPRWSPDGSRLLFYRLLSYRSQATNGKGYGRLVVMDADGANVEVVHGTRSPDPQSAAWSRDGSRILYTSAAGGSRHLESIPVTGGQPERFATSSRDESGGAWSPDGRSVAFVLRANVEVAAPDGPTHQLIDQIWLMDADGSNKRLLATLPDTHAEAPEWSPDGSKIAFIGSRFGIGGVESDTDGVYVIDVASGHITQVVQGVAVGLGHESHATWLPTGDALLVLTRTT